MEKVKREILVIGADGLLGKALVKEMSQAYSVSGTTQGDLDITDGTKVNEMCRRLHPKIIILTAAYTDVDGCEENAALARRVNIEGTRNVAEAAKTIKAVLVFMSTDYVFDGEKKSPYKENDKPCPISIYGQSKFEGEKIVQSLLKEFVIIRSSWLFGEGKRGFIQSISEAIRHKKPLEVVADKFASPTYVVDLSQAISKIVGLILKGLYDFKKNSTIHITNRGVCSWFDMAKFIVETLKPDGVSLNKMDLAEYPFKAKRPRYSALDNSRYNRITASPMRPWQEALREFIQCQKV